MAPTFGLVLAAVACVGIVILARVGAWYRHRLPSHAAAAKQALSSPVPAATVRRSLAILVALVFSKNVYLASLTSFYTFYLIHKFEVSVQSAQLHLFILLAAVATGTFIGGPVGDRTGRKYVIWSRSWVCCPSPSPCPMRTCCGPSC